MAKWRYKLSFIKPLGKTNIFDFFLKFTLLDIRISDLSGEIIFFNIVFTWKKVFKAKERIKKGLQ